MFERVKTAERVQFAVVHPQVAGQIAGARQIYAAVVTKLTVVVLRAKTKKKTKSHGRFKY